MSRQFVIGDIHGSLRAFETLLGLLELSSKDTLILLGDYVDRGPDSRGVMERILALRTELELVPLFGNHEEMMCEAVREVAGGKGVQSEALYGWIHCGGEETLRSYAGKRSNGTDDVERLKRVPDEHWRFLMRQCRDYHETETHIFAHATPLPQVALSEQPLYALRWRKLHDPQPHVSGKTVVVGHTRQPYGRPSSWGHTLALDTGAGTGPSQWLTAFSLGEDYLWQANEQGEHQQGPFDRLGLRL